MSTAPASSWKHPRTVLQGRESSVNKIRLAQLSCGLLGPASADLSCDLGTHVQSEGSQKLLPSLLIPLLDPGPLFLGTVEQLSDPGVQKEKALLCPERVCVCVPATPSPREPGPTQLHSGQQSAQVQREGSRQMAHLCSAGCWLRSSFSPRACRASARDPRVLRSHLKPWCCCSRLWASLRSSWYSE